MNTTAQLGSILAGALASLAFALGLDWLLLCAAFQAMSSALSRPRPVSAAPHRLQVSLLGGTSLRGLDDFR